MGKPDKLWADPTLVSHGECDEFQHSGEDYSCDERRISRLFDEFGGILTVSKCQKAKKG